MADRCRIFALSAASLAASAFLMGADGCPFLGGAACPSMDSCHLTCAGGQLAQGRDGCSVCACPAANDAGPTVCWDDSDCASSERCDTVNFCERAPNCVDGEPCPDACYGECVAATATCLSDADCPQNQACAIIQNGGGANDRPSGGGSTDPSGGGSGVAPLPAPTGVCVDVSCNATNIALPECPPGSEPGVDVAVDPCNATCISVDQCRSLTPDVCATKPGCQLVDGLCIAVDDCSALDPTTCESNPSCILKPIGSGTTTNGGSGGSGGGGGAAPPPCDPTTDPNCAPTDPPPPVEVCVPRNADGTCLSDADCLAGDLCALTTLCGSGCTVEADGTQVCFDQCWTDRGVCTPGDNACSSLPPDQCTVLNGCQLVDETPPSACGCDPASAPGTCDCAQPAPIQVCLPVAASCTADSDCTNGQHCQVAESCPTCNPQNGTTDLNCAAPCFVEGTCVDGAPPPVQCNADSDCGAGGACVAISVCATCPKTPPPPPGSGQPVSPPCDPTCQAENACVFPAPPTTGVTCQADTDCGPGQRCAVELNDPVCVDANGTVGGDGTFCLDDSACGGNGETCRFDADVCLQDPNNSTPVCSGWCVGVCGNVVTTAADASGQCATFPDTCIPPGWQPVPSCTTP